LQLDERALGLGLGSKQLDLGARLTAERTRVDEESRPLLDPDLDIAGSRLQIDRRLGDRLDQLIARRRVDADLLRHLAEDDVAGSGSYGRAVAGRADADVAGGRVHVDSSADPADRDVAARRADARVAFHLLDLDVARSSVDLD